jgi:GNAT superfamily N-acetyltransferase
MLQNLIGEVRLATIHDVDALTDLHLASFQREEHVLMILGRSYVKATYSWLVTSKHAYALVADLTGQIIGLLGVCDSPFAWPMFKACSGALFLSVAKNPSLLLEKKIWQRVFRRPQHRKTPGGGIFKLHGIAQMTIGAVDVRYRGHGIFGRLIEASKETSRPRGTRAIVAGVYKRDSSSRRVFIKSGWPEVPELETPQTVFYLSLLESVLSDDLKVALELGGASIPLHNQ